MKIAVVLLICVALARAQTEEGLKVGDCPPPTPVDVCYQQCFSDIHCEGTHKCCPTQCGGQVCTRPVTERRITIEKPGFCPSKPKGPWVCTSTCRADDDCRGKLKCCKNRCGATACTQPQHYP